MLRSPLEAFGRQRLVTATSMIALSVALWMIAGLGIAFVQLEAAAGEWFEQFVPAVYLEAGADGPDIASLGAEIESWSQISAVDVEPPDASLERLREHLGDDEVHRLGIDEAMMPTRVVVQPRWWRPGQIDVTSKIRALEVREYVVAVDVPETEAILWVERGRLVFVGVALAALLGLVAALLVMTMALRRYQERERKEYHLLEVFGATPPALRMPTVWRGLVLGAAAGLVAALGLLPWSIAVQNWVVDTVGQGAFSALRSALWALANVPIGAAIGAVVGWCCRRPKAMDDAGAQQSDGLLQWRRESP